MSKLIDLTDKKFGRLTILYRIENNKCGQTRWHCRCDCGNEIDVFGGNLRKGHTRSCGCLKNEQIQKCSIKQNEYKFTDDYITAKTSNGIEFYVDKDDEWVFARYCWSIDGHGYIKACERGTHDKVWIHRLIVDCPDGYIVDHINGNPLDNRKSNLRVATRSQNNMNRKIQSNNNSGVTGVSFYQRKNMWSSEILVNKKKIHIGYFDKFDDAVAARKKAEEKYFGEYSFDNSRNKTTEQTEVVS